MTTKAKLYARAGIVEYWVVDIAARRLVVHRDPREGQYRSVIAYADHEATAPLAAPQSDFRVASGFDASVKLPIVQPRDCPTEDLAMRALNQTVLAGGRVDDF